MSSKTVIIIGGPTASGKTAMAIAVAQHFGTEIISADSRQCYRELEIGVARPSPAELASAPHHFIASHSVHDHVNAATFETYALAKAADIFKQHDVAVMVGGTGLYIRAFCEGLDAIPEVPGHIRQAVRGDFEAAGLSWLRAEVARVDPAFYAVGETQNPQRLLRALEVHRATGQSILAFRSGSKLERPFNTIKLALDLPREQLYQQINRRVDQMFATGLETEVRCLLPFQHLNALQTVGYRELFGYFNKEYTLDAAAEAIKRNTRHYAKRQLTWFRRDPAFTWFAPADREAVIAHIHQHLGA